MKRKGRRPDWVSRAMRAAATRAVNLVRGSSIVGLGSGRTVALAVEELGKRIREENLQVTVVPTSYQLEFLAARQGIHLANLSECQKIDLAIDGADQVERTSLNLIKGAGGALTREKIVDSAAHRLVIIVDEKKMTRKLGLGRSVPIEVIPFGVRPVTQAVSRLGGRAVLREGNGKLGPIVTDNGNFILDVDFGPISRATELERKLKLIPGVVETGLFIAMTDLVFVGKRNGDVEALGHTQSRKVKS